MLKVLIAGSTGFVGSSLKKRLLNDQKFSVKTINRDWGDYTFSDLDSINESFDLIFVLFAILPSKEKTLKDFRSVNVELTKKLVSKFSNSRFVFTSSISVYENALKKPCDESTLSLGLSDYAKSKFEAEMIFKNLNSIVLRLGSVYGPGMKKNSFLPIVVKSALENKQVRLIGNIERKQNYTFIDDVIDFLITAANSDIKGIYNAVNDRSYTNEELALTVKNLVPDVEIIKEENEEPVYSYEISNEKWLNCFNHGSKISLEEGLRKYLEHKQK